MPNAYHGPARISSPPPKTVLYPAPSSWEETPLDGEARSGPDDSQGSQANLTSPNLRITLRNDNATWSTMPGRGRSASASGDREATMSAPSPWRSSGQDGWQPVPADRAPPPKQSHQTHRPSRPETANAVPEKDEAGKKRSLSGSLTLCPGRHANSINNHEHVKYT